MSRFRRGCWVSCMLGVLIYPMITAQAATGIPAPADRPFPGVIQLAAWCTSMKP
jgi:hypothetical protein